MTEHDTSYKKLFSDPFMVKGLLRYFVPEEWQTALDLNSLEKMNGSYVTDDLRSRHSDMVWRLRCGDDWLYLYLLLEFQATVDTRMALRITAYTCLLYQDLVQRGESPPHQPLPPVLPIVLYNGDSRWHAPTDQAELIQPAPPGLDRFQPRQAYWLIDEGAFDPDALDPASNAVVTLFRLEHHRSMGELAELVGHLVHLLDQPHLAGLRRDFTEWLNRRARVWFSGETLPELTNLQEGYDMIRNTAEEWKHHHHQAGLAQGLEQGVAQGLEQGMAQGLTQGEQALLVRQLRRRFGDIPETFHRRLENASLEELETWADRILDAESPEDVFR